MSKQIFTVFLLGMVSIVSLNIDAAPTGRPRPVANGPKGTVKLSVELNPTGSFVAESAQVNGFARKVADGYVAQNVSLVLNTLKTGIDLRDRHMLLNYFETKKYPYAILVNAKAGSGGRFKGILKVRNMPQPIEGEYSVNGSNLEATFKSKLSTYRIRKAAYMGVGVEDEVEVKVTLPVR